jgi:cell division protein FtsL
VGQAAAADRPRRGPAKPRLQPKPKARAKRAPRVRVAGGAVWIGIVAVLLSGVVALNVAVLQLNVQLEDLGTERTQLRAENADLASEIASKAQAGRIHTLARGRLGLEVADAGRTTYLNVGSGGK